MECKGGGDITRFANWRGKPYARLAVIQHRGGTYTQCANSMAGFYSLGGPWRPTRPKIRKVRENQK